MSTIVATLSKTDMLCRRFLKSLFQHHPNFPSSEVLVVDDGLDIQSLVTDYPGISVVNGESPFAYSRNANKAFAVARDRGANLLLCNDDTRFTSMNDIHVLEALSQMHQPGILSPQFSGGVNNAKQRKGYRIDGDVVIECENILCFVAVYIPLRTLAVVGDMNTIFDHRTYGFEDNEYCDRTRMSGFPLMITGRVVMEHGYGEKECSVTYSKMPDLQTMVIRGMIRYEKLRKEHQEALVQGKSLPNPVVQP